MSEENTTNAPSVKARVESLIKDAKTLAECKDPKEIVKKIKEEIPKGNSFIISQCFKRLVELDFYPGDKLVRQLLKESFIVLSTLIPYGNRCKVTFSVLRKYFKNKNLNVEFSIESGSNLRAFSPILKEMNDPKDLELFTKHATKSATFADIIVRANDSFTKEQLQKIFIANTDIALCDMIEEKIKMK
jgi:hypothetical protein